MWILVEMVRSFTIFLSFATFAFVQARFCSDSKKGVCEISDSGSFCYHNKTSGQYNCDDQGYCANKENIKGKVGLAGCYATNADDEPTDCCCNKGQLCNLAMAAADPENNPELQKCTYLVDESDQDTLLYKDCLEPYCLSFMHSNLIGTKTTVMHGCETRFIYKHVQAKQDFENYGNNTDWQATEPVYNYPRCSDILENVVPNINGTKRACLDLFFKLNGESVKGKLCCCNGSDNCNEQITWNEPVIRLEDIRSDNNGLANDSYHSLTNTVPFILSLFLSFSFSHYF
uniref:Activin_recp domain-containing protein n=1 Tax=Rhabditophanes sp. KR3021 TaxID=114890 RepID=A0AC35U403_9BILA